MITSIVMALALNLNAQLVLDDFTTGPRNQANISMLGEKKYNQNVTKILNKKRSVILKIKENPQKQLFQTKIVKGKLVTSIGYGIVGGVELRYGYDSPEKLNLDLTKFKNLHIEYEAKSNFGRVYVSMFSNGPNRAFWRGGGKTTERFGGSISPSGVNKPFVLKIPLSEFVSAQDNAGVENKFTMKDVDFFKIQFICQGQQGLNFAVKKIWIE